jgi:hypothetical protein
MTFYEMVEEFRDEKGDLVAESRSTSIRLRAPAGEHA